MADEFAPLETTFAECPASAAQLDRQKPPVNEFGHRRHRW